MNNNNSVDTEANWIALARFMVDEELPLTQQAIERAIDEVELAMQSRPYSEKDYIRDRYSPSYKREKVLA